MTYLIDTEAALECLATERTVFHSEADFQHALAWSIQKKHPAISVRLELPFRTDASSEYLDLLFADKQRSLAVELKYKTRKLAFSYGGEDFKLKNQGAQDIGRYDFLADVQRLERFVAAKRATAGCAILLTNETSYWKKSARVGTVDTHLRFSQGQVLNGSLGWLGHAAPGTTRNREEPIVLQGTYTADWKIFSTPTAEPGGEFRYLVWHVG